MAVSVSIVSGEGLRRKYYIPCWIRRFSSCVPTSAWSSLCNNNVEGFLWVKEDEA